MIKYSIESRNISNINWTLDHIIGYGMKYIDDYEPKALILESIIDSLLENQKDREKNFIYVHSGILKLQILTKKELRKEAIDLGLKLIKIFDNSKLDTNWSLIFKILISLIMFSNDPESINQGELLKMRRDFVSITDLIGTDLQYEVYYTGIGIFGTIVQIFQAMNITCDPAIPLKYINFLKDQKDTLIKFFTSSECYAEVSIEEPLKIAIQYLDELGAHELNNMRITLNFQLIIIGFMSGEEIKVRENYKKLQDFINFLTQHKDTYDYINQKLMCWYQLILPMLLSMEDSQGYIKYAELLIESVIKENDYREAIWRIMDTTVNLYLNFGQIEKVNFDRKFN